MNTFKNIYSYSLFMNISVFMKSIDCSTFWDPESRTLLELACKLEAAAAAASCTIGCGFTSDFDRTGGAQKATW